MATADELNARIQRVESKVDALAVSVDEMSAEHRDQTAVDQRFDALDQRLDALEGRIDAVTRLEEKAGGAWGPLLAESPAKVPEVRANSENIWDKLAPVLESRVGRLRFNTWVKDLSFVSDDGATLHLRGPDSLYCDFFVHKFGPIVQTLLAEFGRAGTKLLVKVG